MSHRLAEFVEEFERAAETADDIEQRDAAAVLAAMARGDPVPTEVAQRVMERVKAEG